MIAFLTFFLGFFLGFFAASLFATAGRNSREAEIQRVMDHLYRARKFTAGADIKPGDLVVSLGDEVWPAPEVPIPGEFHRTHQPTGRQEDGTPARTARCRGRA
jgi:hypothetical protein